MITGKTTSRPKAQKVMAVLEDQLLFQPPGKEDVQRNSSHAGALTRSLAVDSMLFVYVVGFLSI